MAIISIIIPVYNIEKYLQISLDSILNQTFQDFEIICVDDGSSDKSVEILKLYSAKDSRFTVLQAKHGGSGAARNAGLKLARGKYIQFLDGDDYFEPQMLEKLYNLAEEHEADIAVCSSRKVNDMGEITESGNPNSPLNQDLLTLKKPFSYKDYPDNIFNLIGTAPWNKLYRHDMILENNLEFPKLTGPDDMCFVHLANICANKIVAIKDELINYRFNRPGSVQTYRANHTIDIIKAWLYIKDFMQKKGIFDTVKQAYLNGMLTSVRWEVALCNEEQYKKFEEELKVLLPDDWEFFNSALRKDYITPEYISKFIGNKKVMLWGASLFIRKILETEYEKNPNILGVIDKNSASWGTKCGNYEIYPPESINELKPEGIILTVYSNNESLYPVIKQELREKYPKVELMRNIFGESANA